MALKGTTVAQRGWNFLSSKGLSACGISGLIGNLDKESGLRPNNLQNTFENNPKRTGGVSYTDATYVTAVDNGTYQNFVKDGAGFGLAQWTYWSRKQGLLDAAKKAGKSIADEETQWNYLWYELTTTFKSLLAKLKTVSSVQEASDLVLMEFEKPASINDPVRLKQVKAERGAASQKYYDQFAKASNPQKEESIMGFSNSPLATVTMISPNKTVNRNHIIDTITIHCFVGQVNAKRGCEVFLPSSKQASCNYVVGYDGSIGLCVEEKDRSWCTGGYKKVNGVKVPIRVNGVSGASNDYGAVTIEVACESKDPYTVTPRAMDALIALVADICKRNNILKLLWSGDKNLVGNPAKQNMTVHRWFAPKACPGDYLYSRMGQIAAEVNKRLGVTSGSAQTGTTKPMTVPTTGCPYKVKVTATDLRIRKGPSTDTAIVKTAIEPGVYTIVNEATGKGATKWGKLKSGIGWFSLDFATKI